MSDNSSAGTSATTTSPATSGLQAFLNKLAAWAKSAETEIVAVAEQFISDVENDLEIAFEDLASIAGNAVIKASAALVTGEEKFGQAVTDVVQQVEIAGKTVAIQTAQMAVQQAYVAVQQTAIALTPAADQQK